MAAQHSGISPERWASYPRAQQLLMIANEMNRASRLFGPEDRERLLASYERVLALAKKYSDALANGQVLAPAKSIDQMQHVIFNAYTNATLTALFLFVVFSILFFALKVGIAAWGTKERTDKEAPYQALPDA